MSTTTKNYLLEFKGWVQSRLATDPDPSNEPQGVSGYTFAVPGEPDMDQVIYFQNKNGVVQRSHTNEVGVKVTGGFEFETKGEKGEVEFAGKKNPIVAGHPLFDAKVDLLGNAIFDSRNSTIVYYGFGIINPCILNIEGKNISFTRRFYVDPKNPQDDLGNYSIDEITNNLGNMLVPTPNNLQDNGFVLMDSPEMILEAGVLDRTAFRNERLKLLRDDLKNEKDKVKIAALKKRIAELEVKDPQNRRTRQIGTQAMFELPLNAKEADVNGKKINPSAAWPLVMWMGGWDADALQFYVRGYVQVIY